MFDQETVAKGLLRLTNWFSSYNMWFCGMASTMEGAFEESYAVRAMLHAERVLGIGHMQDIAHTYCDLMIKLQGAHWEDMFDMGYGYDLDDRGVVNCSCVADNASTARAILETVKAYPDYPKNGEYIQAVRRYADYVLSHFVTDTGVIGVGILNHQGNPMVEYWCANGLFSQVLTALGDATGEQRYYLAAVAPMEYLATFDYRNTDWKEWSTSAPMVILYSGEGVVEGLTHPGMKHLLDVPLRHVTKNTADGVGDKTEGISQAANRIKAEVESAVSTGGGTIAEALRQRWAVWTDWLKKNQEACGLWESPSGKSYRDYEPGLSWLIARSLVGVGYDRALEQAAARQLNYLLGRGAKSHFGLYCRPFSTALAYLSFASIAERCRAEDPDSMDAAIAAAMKNDPDLLW
jgi:hypothetical protein